MSQMQCALKVMAQDIGQMMENVNQLPDKISTRASNLLETIQNQVEEFAMLQKDHEPLDLARARLMHKVQGEERKNLEANRLLQNYRTLLKYIMNTPVHGLWEWEMTGSKQLWHILTVQLNKLAVDNREESLAHLEEKQISDQSLEYHHRQIKCVMTAPETFLESHSYMGQNFKTNIKDFLINLEWHLQTYAFAPAQALKFGILTSYSWNCSKGERKQRLVTALHTSFNKNLQNLQTLQGKIRVLAPFTFWNLKSEIDKRLMKYLLIEQSSFCCDCAGHGFLGGPPDWISFPQHMPTWEKARTDLIRPGESLPSTEQIRAEFIGQTISFLTREVTGLTAISTLPDTMKGQAEYCEENHLGLYKTHLNQCLIKALQEESGYDLELPLNHEIRMHNIQGQLLSCCPCTWHDKYRNSQKGQKQKKENLKKGSDKMAARLDIITDLIRRFSSPKSLHVHGTLQPQLWNFKGPSEMMFEMEAHCNYEILQPKEDGSPRVRYLWLLYRTAVIEDRNDNGTLLTFFRQSNLVKELATHSIFGHYLEPIDRAPNVSKMEIPPMRQETPASQPESDLDPTGKELSKAKRVLSPAPTNTPPKKAKIQPTRSSDRLLKQASGEKKETSSAGTLRALLQVDTSSGVKLASADSTPTSSEKASPNSLPPISSLLRQKPLNPPVEVINIAETVSAVQKAQPNQSHCSHPDKSTTEVSQIHGSVESCSYIAPQFYQGPDLTYQPLNLDYTEVGQYTPLHHYPNNKWGRSQTWVDPNTQAKTTVVYPPAHYYRSTTSHQTNSVPFPSTSAIYDNRSMQTPSGQTDITKSENTTMKDY